MRQAANYENSPIARKQVELRCARSHIDPLCDSEKRQSDLTGDFCNRWNSREFTCDRTVTFLRQIEVQIANGKTTP